MNRLAITASLRFFDPRHLEVPPTFALRKEIAASGAQIAADLGPAAPKLWSAGYYLPMRAKSASL
jgi:hypothetical protein